MSGCGDETGGAPPDFVRQGSKILKSTTKNTKKYTKKNQIPSNSFLNISALYADISDNFWLEYLATLLRCFDQNKTPAKSVSSLDLKLEKFKRVVCRTTIED
jgi:hypothetical protein